MPPGAKLSASDIDVLTEWVKRGAPWGTKLRADGGAKFFDQRVAPILRGKCISCHKSEMKELDKAALLESVRYQGKKRMPPDEKLPAADIAVLEEWVERGAPWGNSL